jgi:hypothetical protein
MMESATGCIAGTLNMATPYRFARKKREKGWRRGVKKE